jgi:hypothetical protein
MVPVSHGLLERRKIHPNRVGDDVVSGGALP